MPMPDLAVPYAAPMPTFIHKPMFPPTLSLLVIVILPNIIANATPAIPKKGANLGDKSTPTSAILEEMLEGQEGQVLWSSFSVW